MSPYVSGSPAPTLGLNDAAPLYTDFDQATGEFTFAPDDLGTFSFTFTASNTLGIASNTLSVTVDAIAPELDAIGDRSGTLGDDVVFPVSATGDPVPGFDVTSDDAEAVVIDQDGTNYFFFTPDAIGTYHFTVTATNIAGNDSETFTVTVTDAPVTVPTLTVADVDSTSATASWTACDGVTSYTLQLASDDQFTTGGSGATVTLFSNDGTSATAPDGWTYSINSASSGYPVLASNNYVVSEAVDASSCIALTLSLSMRTYGAVSSGTTNLLVQYSADGGASWTDIGNLSVPNKTWATRTLDATAAAGAADLRIRFVSTSPSTSSGVGIQSIVLSGTESAGGGSLISTDTVNGLSHAFTGLDTDTTYYARVKGTSDWSSVVSFTTQSTGASAPVVTVPQDSYSVLVGAPAISFAVTATGTPAPTVTATCTEGADFGFENNTFVFEPSAIGTYHFVFTATNSEGSDSKTVTVTVAGAAPSISVPQTSYAVAVGDVVNFTVNATGAPEPTVTATCTEGVDFVFENKAFRFTPAAVGTYHFVFTATNSEGSDSETVTIVVSPPPVTVPELTVSDVTTTTALASWTACDGVSTYTLQLATNDFPAASGASRSLTTLLHETFAQASGTATITSFDSKADNPGWEGSYVLAHNGAVRLSSGSGSGELVSPWLTNTTAGASVRVVFSSLTWTNDYTSAVIDITEDGENFTDSNSFELGASMQAYTNTFTVTGTRFRIRWTPSANKKRFFLDDITITTPTSGGGDEPAGDDVQEFPVTGTSHTFTNLTPETTYYSRVKGNAGWSGTVSFQTLGSSDTAPSIEAIADQTYTYGDNEGIFTLIVAATGTPSPSFSVTSPDAPEGRFTIGENDGEFLFEPAAVGTFHFTVTATNGVSPDATATFAVTVTGTAPTLAAIADQTVSVEAGDLTVGLIVTGNPAPTVTVDSSDAPHDSFCIDSNGDFYFLFDEATGTFHFTITAANGVSPDATQSFAVTVTAAPEPLSDYQQWLQAHGIATDTAADATASNGHTYGENYAADIDPSSPQWLEITVTTTNFTFAPSSTNRYYQLLYTTDLSTGIYQTNNLGQGATSGTTSGSFPEVEGDWYGGLRVTPDEPAAP